MEAIERLLDMKPFGIGSREKEELFLQAIKESAVFHYSNCGMYRKLCEKRGFNPNASFRLEELPFLPVSLFKTVKLLSVSENEIVKSVHSSSTSSGVPSKIYLDSVTAKRQVKVLSSIMASFIGPERKVFIVFDSPSTVKSEDSRLSSRATAIRGMLPFSKSMFFLLDENLELDITALEKAAKAAEGERVCFLGFTFLIYLTIEKYKDNRETKAILSRIENAHVLHLGGWKRLQELKLDKKEFSRRAASFLNTQENKVTDIYGMTEQLGTIYPDCEFGFKHVPAYSEIIIRDVQTLKPVGNGMPGFIQLLTPVPNSYPGISIISDDIGVVVKDGCECGRNGKTFFFVSRAEKAELKGCGDTLKQAG